MGIERDASVLLILEESLKPAAMRRRDRNSEGILPVGDVLSRQDEASLRTAMGFPEAAGDLAMARYAHVCVLAPEDSPLRVIVPAWFFRHMRPLVEAGGLFVCDAPFRRADATQISIGEAEAAAAVDDARMAEEGGRGAVQDRIDERTRLWDRVGRAVDREEKQATTDVIEALFRRLAGKDKQRASALLRRLELSLAQQSERESDKT